jgi:transcriptional regulator of NAD metabolism
MVPEDLVDQSMKDMKYDALRETAERLKRVEGGEISHRIFSAGDGRDTSQI